MGSFLINGGKSLQGEITPQGAKNEALQILSAVLLSEDKIRINNVPDILDVRKLIELLIGLGVKVERHADEEFTFQADNIDLDYFASQTYLDNARRIRGSVMLMGPLLARFAAALTYLSPRRFRSR